MKPPPFSYHRPETRSEALSMLQTLGNAKLLAGGQSLMPMMNFRYVLPDHVIDLNRCADLVGVTETGDDVLIGAMTRQRDLEQNEMIRYQLPLLVDALQWVGHVQTRNRGTIGGSLAHLDPAAELPAALLAYDAVLQVDGPEGEREIPVANWSQGYMTPSIAPAELLTAIRVPKPTAGHCHGFYEVARRHGDFAQAGAGVVFSRDKDRIQDVRIALCGVDVAPRRLTEAEHRLSGQVATPELVQSVSKYAFDMPGIEDVHADAAYRKRIACVVVRRAIEQALAS